MTKQPSPLQLTLLLTLLLTALTSHQTFAGYDQAGDQRFSVDQFGYLPHSSKVVVVRKAQSGQFSPDSYTAPATLQLRKLSDSSVVFTGALAQWEGGKTDALSGDQGWWFDFTSISTPGNYYVWDDLNTIGSHPFAINDTLYQPVLKEALRSFYYQRCGVDKATPYAHSDWADIACHTGDTNTPYAFDSTNTSLNRDLSGGWHDAGDYNKYITFLGEVLHPMLQAYQDNPSVWDDHADIPESNNGTPDILDEIEVEISWMQKMQDDDGGVFIKMGVTNYSAGSPASSHHDRRYYGKKASSSSIMFAGIIAHAATVYKTDTNLSSKVASMTTAAQKAWQWYHANPKGEDYDNNEVKSGDADRTIEQQKADAVVAALWLYVLTDDETYHTYFKNNYTLLYGLGSSSNTWWGPYRVEEAEASLFYTTLPTADQSVVSAINSSKSQSGSLTDFYQFYPSAHLYRSHMPTGQWHWGSLKQLSMLGVLNLQFNRYSIDTQNSASYDTRGWNALHYIHGVNPLSKVYLSNMYDVGASNSVDEFYHSWFKDGSQWDNVRSSKGPAPGFLVGGPNASYTGSYPALVNQPAEKTYIDYNDLYPEVAWEITENSVSYNANYLSLLSRLMADTTLTPISTPIPTSQKSTALSLSVQKGRISGSIVGGGFNDAHIIMHNSKGQQVYSAPLFVSTAGLFSTTGPHLAQGVYSLSIMSGKRRVGTQQIIW